MRWRRPRTIQVVAVVCSLLAAGSVLVVFNRLSARAASAIAGAPLIATVDLRLGNTILAAERGASQARADIAAGLLQLLTFAPDEPQSRAEAVHAQQWKQRYGVTWLHKSDARTPVSQAYTDGYNRVVRAEIERRHGRKVLDQLMPKEVCGTSGVPCS